MNRTDRNDGGFVLEVHLTGGEVVRAPHTLAQVKQAVADAAKWSEVAAAASDWGGRVDLSVALTTAYRRMLVVSGGLILADQEGGVWNIDESRVIALRVTDPTDRPDTPEPRQIGFRFERRPPLSSHPVHRAVYIHSLHTGMHHLIEVSRLHPLA